MILQLRVSRFLGALCLLLFLFCGAVQAATWELWQDNLKKGNVTVRLAQAGTQVALDEMMVNLGFVGSTSSSELIVTYGGKKLEFWQGSMVARSAGQPISFTSPVVFEGGHWWGESSAALRAVDQFLLAVNRPHGLRWVVPTADTMPTEAPPLAPSFKVVGTVEKKGAAQVTKIRWGEQPNAHRVVIDLSGQTDVSLVRHQGKTEVSFSASLTPDVKGGGSPWPTLVQLQVANSGGKSILTFTHSAAEVKGFWLTNPSRYVVDFMGKKADPKTVQKTNPPSLPAVIVTTDTSRPAESSTIGTAEAVETPGVRPQGKKPLVVIDAGHGGRDPGAVGFGLREKDINLKAAMQLMTQLQNKGVEVRLTRRDDTYLKLGERTALANNWDADLFVSLHCNALPAGRHAKGIEIYLMAPPSDKDAMSLAIFENKEIAGEGTNDSAAEVNADKKTRLLLKILGDMQQNDKISESTVVAESLYNQAKKSGLDMKRVRQAPFFVLRGAGMPAVLVEMGFISERSDANLLNSAAFREKLAASLAQGLVGYLNQTTREGTP